MSKTINGFETAVVWGTEATQGTPAVAFPFLWNGAESDSLTPGETPIDERPFTGNRGQNSVSFRAGQNLPGGGLGKATLPFGTDAVAVIRMLQAHFQNVVETGVAAPYTYTASPIGSAIEDGSFHTISLVKNTGVEDKCHGFYGCVIPDLEIGWEGAGGIFANPSGVKAMSFSPEVTMPSIPAPSADGYIQAPNIAVSWNGTEIQPAKWSYLGKDLAGDKISGSATGRWGHSVGDYEAMITLDVWRSGDSDTRWVSPFYANTLGTLSIVGTMDLSYGSVAAATPVTFTLTAYCMVEKPLDLPTGEGDLTDAVSLKVMNNTDISIAITAKSTGLV
ncbi:MAG: hypothetical protein KAU20_06405 [Nanoarchaeota archaeon]|nr:hypothetical protein [Nanoarchaeota archaeon]